MNKKAALELSITAIVVLIIAITVLGLGIGFIKKQFGAGTKLVESQLAEIKENLKQQVRTGGELLVFNVPDQITPGKPEGMVIGIRNTAGAKEGKDRVCFRVEVRCIKPFTPDSYCDSKNQKNEVAVGGYDAETGEPVKGDRSWFKSILGEFNLKSYEGDVFDSEMLVRGLAPDSYSMEINVYKEPDGNDCSEQNFGTNYQKSSLYSSKTFILKVV